MAELRRQRHDLRHQLAAIQQMAETHPEQLKEFISSLLDAIPAAPRTYCENPAVNAVVSHYAARCQGQVLDVQIRLDLPQRLEWVTDGELCIIFGNLLENALEACGCMEQGRKFLRLGSQVHYDVLTITMDNNRSAERTAPFAPVSGASWAWASPPSRPWPGSTRATRTACGSGPRFKAARSCWSPFVSISWFLLPLSPPSSRNVLMRKGSRHGGLLPCSLSCRLQDQTSPHCPPLAPIRSGIIYETHIQNLLSPGRLQQSSTHIRTNGHGNLVPGRAAAIPNAGGLYRQHHREVAETLRRHRPRGF